MKMEKEKDLSRPLLHWISSVAGKAKWYIVILLLIQICLGMTSVGFALFLRRMINAATAGDHAGFLRASVLFTGLVIAQIAMRAGNRYFEEKSRSTIENRFKSHLFRAVLGRDYASVTRVHSGEWMNRLTSDTVVVADGMTQILPGMAGMAVKLTGALAALLWLEPRFLFIMIPGGILMLFFSYAFRRVLKRMHRQIQEADGRLRIFLSERLESLMIVRTFAREKQSGEQADQLMKEHQTARMKRNRFSNLCNIGFGAAMNGAYVASAVFCGYGILTGTISYGDFTAILQLVSQIQNPFANITGYLPKYYALLASAERLREADAFPADPEPVLSCADLLPFYRDSFTGIRLRDAGFTYQSPVGMTEKTEMPVVLSGLNLEIRKGEYVAFAGPSGCGKSTVLRLMMCLYPLDSGDRFLLTTDGTLPLTQEYRRLYSYVPQGNQLMSGSLREIVTFGDPTRMSDDAGIHRALRTACAEEFVSGLPDGIDTQLGEKGTGLSEGQMQRVAIARAVYSDSPVMLLDEATSSLDAATERRLLENLRQMTEKTVVIVTHRDAAFAICDRVLYFTEEGILES